ncbi:hypothetical protein BEJ65_23905, partial [Escherichia coli]
KAKRGGFAAHPVFCPPAVGAARETKKALWEFHTRTARGGLSFFPAYGPEKEQGGGVTPATLQVLAYLQRTLVFTLACPRAGFWGG